MNVEDTYHDNAECSRHLNHTSERPPQPHVIKTRQQQPIPALNLYTYPKFRIHFFHILDNIFDISATRL